MPSSRTWNQVLPLGNGLQLLLLLHPFTIPLYHMPSGHRTNFFPFFLLFTLKLALFLRKRFILFHSIILSCCIMKRHSLHRVPPRKRQTAGLSFPLHSLLSSFIMKRRKKRSGRHGPYRFCGARSCHGAGGAQRLGAARKTIRLKPHSSLYRGWRHPAGRPIPTACQRHASGGGRSNRRRPGPAAKNATRISGVSITVPRRKRKESGLE